MITEKWIISVGNYKWQDNPIWDIRCGLGWNAFFSAKQSLLLESMLNTAIRLKHQGHVAIWAVANIKIGPVLILSEISFPAIEEKSACSSTF